MFDRTGRSSVVLAALALAAHTVAPAFAATRALDVPPPVPSAAERYGALPMRFEPNVGQFDERVEFVARAGGYTLALAPGESVLTLTPSAPDFSRRREGAKAQRPEVVRTRLVGANTRSSGEGVGELPGVTNYFRGNDPSRWRTGIVSYGAVRYEGIYPGIDVVYYRNGNDLEYDFVVAPGADPSAIRMQIEGADRMRVDASGDLVLSVAGGELRQRAPAIYQDGPGGSERVAGGYVVRGDVVTFDVGAYDPARPLVVDPVLAYSRPLDFADATYAIAVGADGCAYITGDTFVSFDGEIYDTDVYVAKLDPTGSTLVYLTSFGGEKQDWGYGIAVGADGSAYVFGTTTSTNFPTASPLQANHAGGYYDAFVTKLSPSGSSLVYSTYLGGSGQDGASGIALGADGSAYVAGGTGSTDFPGPRTFGAPGASGAFVTELAPSGATLVYTAILVGGSAYSLAVGPDGSAYVTGAASSSATFPTVNAVQGTFGGGMVDAFVTKLSPPGTGLVYSTYLGGGGYDAGYAIALGADGSAYVSGVTTSPNFPTAAPLQANIAGDSDAFVTKLSASGSSLVYSTYLGGTQGDEIKGIAVGADGSAYVTGQTYSYDFPTAAPIQANYGGDLDAFVTKLSPSGSALSYSTYFGTDISEVGFGIAVGAGGSAYIGGATGFDLGTFLVDGFVMKINPGTATTPGVYVPFTGAWFLRNSSSAGAADLVFTYGPGGTAVPIAGDWNGDGIDTPGIYFRTTGAFFLKNANAGGAADLAFTFGVGGAGIVPLSGDWDGDGDDTIGLYDPASGAFFLKNANASGPADLIFTFGGGGAGIVPLAGDWDGDGVTTVGLYNPASGAFFLKNANAGGAADLVFTFGAGGQGYVPLAGDWDGDNRDTVGLYAAATGTFFLRRENAPGAADLVFSYGPPGATPLAGDWDGF